LLEEVAYYLGHITQSGAPAIQTDILLLGCTRAASAYDTTRGAASKN
jgi:hypothetical protein